MHVSCASGWWQLISVVIEPYFLLLFLLSLDFPWVPIYAVIASLEKIGSLINTISSSKNSTNFFNDCSLCWLFYSANIFLFQLSATPFDNFKTNMHRVPGVKDCCIYSRKQRTLVMTFASPYFIGGQSLFPFCEIHIFYVDLDTAFPVTSLHFGTQDVFFVEHKALWVTLLHHLYI